MNDREAAVWNEDPEEPSTTHKTSWKQLTWNAVYGRRIGIGMTLVAMAIDFLCGYVTGTNMGPSWGIYVALGVLLGLVCVQLDLIGLWGGLGPQVWLVRIPWTSLMVVLAAMSFSVAQNSRSNSAAILSALLLSSICVQLPFLVYGKIWKVRFAHRDTVLSRSNQFNIANLLFSTSLLAVAIAVTRMLLPQFSFRDLFRLDGIAMVLLTSLIITNLLTCGPLLFYLLKSSAPRLKIGVAWILIGPIFSGIEGMSMIAILGRPSQIEALFIWLFFLNTTQCFGLAAAILFLKHCGYGLFPVMDAPRDEDEPDGEGEAS